MKKRLENFKNNVLSKGEITEIKGASMGDTDLPGAGCVYTVAFCWRSGSTKNAKKVNGTTTCC